MDTQALLLPGDSDSALSLGHAGFRVVCAHHDHDRTSTGQLSSGGLFLNRVSVRRHIAEIQVESRAGDSDVMAGAGGAAGPAPDVRLQEQGDTNL